MKKTFKSILAMILCAMIAITGIGTETAYAANSKTPIKVTFNKKTVTLSKDINKGIKQADFKILKEKWGEPEYFDDKEYPSWSWKKGKATINYSDNIPVPARSGFYIETSDKNCSICGLKVGMKESKAKKIMKKLGAEKPYNFAAYESGRTTLSCEFTNGKVSNIRLSARASELSKQ